MLKQWVTATAAVLAISANASEVHSDIEVGVEAGKLTTESTLQLLSDGSSVYESEFGESVLEPYGSDEPGFEVDDGVFTSGQTLAFQVASPLQFWDGSSWLAATPGSESISIFDNVGNTTTVTDSGVSGTLIGTIDAADIDGGIHTHVEFEINNTAATGSYLLELQLLGFQTSALTTQAYTASDSFFIVFNWGQSEEDFETSVDALGVTAVPVPGAAVLMLSALSALVFGRRISRRS